MAREFKMINLSKDVDERLDLISQEVGDCERNTFHSMVSVGVCEYAIESPIEQLFFMAFKAVQKMEGYQNAEPIQHKDGTLDLYGVLVQPQHSIDKYRVDFLVSYHLFDKIKQAVVECDGHDFHDRDEKQRRYEKQRDRFIQSAGYRIFHFTGKEIKDDPMMCAAEVFNFITR